MVCALATCPKRSPFDSTARKTIAKIGREIFERTIPASFTPRRERIAGPRSRGKPLQIAVDSMPGTTEGPERDVRLPPSSSTKADMRGGPRRPETHRTARSGFPRNVDMDQAFAGLIQTQWFSY